MNDMSGTDLIERAFSHSGFLGFHAWGDALVFIHIFCRIASERDGRDRFALAALTPCQCGLRHFDHAVITASCVPNGPREWWANGMPFRPQHSEFIRSDASERGSRLQNGLKKTRSAI